MKTKVSELNQKAKSLVLLAKEKGRIKSHTDAFKEFPVEKENHKGNIEGYKKKWKQKEKW